MMKKTLFAAFFLSAASLFAGSADALIQGKTSSGRTSVVVEVGDIDGVIRSVKLTIDGESYSFTEDEISSQAVVKDAENGVYFMVAESGDRVFRLWMVPNSEKVADVEAPSYRSRFVAVIEATDPRKERLGYLTPRITVGCTLDYEI